VILQPLSYPSVTTKLENGINNYFNLRNSSIVETILKVASYATLILPLIVLALQWYLKASSPIIIAPVSVIAPIPLDAKIEAVIGQTPAFNGYRIGRSTPYEGITLTTPTIRPANLLLHAIFGNGCTTLPGSGELFRFTRPHKGLRDQINNTPPEQVVEVSARGVPGKIGEVDVPDLASLYGEKTFKISYKELQGTLASRRVYCAPSLPMLFYQGLKAAMQQDQIVILPGNDQTPCKTGDFPTPACQAFLKQVRLNPTKWGFHSADDCEKMFTLSLYQLGSFVVKTEDFRILLDQNGKLREREPGQPDAIRLINLCGIRGLSQTPGDINRQIMKETFQTGLQAAGDGFFILPAVGMGIWGGDPDLYWRALLDAVVDCQAPIEKIFINPGHQQTQRGSYRGCNGNEFNHIFGEYLDRYKNDPASYAKLQNIINLHAKSTDIVHLAQHLKAAYPNKSVSLVNASDPDVTLGNHVGQYVNNLNHPYTTEENLSALGTNPLLIIY